MSDITNYYLKEGTIESNQKHAGSKARIDVEVILKNKYFQCVHSSVYYVKRNILGKFIEQLKIKREWENKFSEIPNSTCLFIQYPVDTFLFTLFGGLKKLKKRGISVCLIVHDLEIFRFRNVKKTSFRRKIALYFSDIKNLKDCQFIIVHNEAMKLCLANEFNIPMEKMVTLGIFDYLQSHTIKNNTLSKDVIIAGNLDKNKCGYLSDLPNDVNWKLYGVGYEDKGIKNITYCGAYMPDELPQHLEGAFGLVWDGDSAESCIGVYGEYLKINNPHKTSLYLSSGIPVIVWEQAAIADFIKKNNCGFTVSSLKEIGKKIAEISEEEYSEMKDNAEAIAEKLRVGYYMNQAIENCISKHEDYKKNV